jgi:hypothetical protein
MRLVTIIDIPPITIIDVSHGLQRAIVARARAEARVREFEARLKQLQADEP